MVVADTRVRDQIAPLVQWVVAGPRSADHLLQATGGLAFEDEPTQPGGMRVFQFPHRLAGCTRGPAVAQSALRRIGGAAIGACHHLRTAIDGRGDPAVLAPVYGALGDDLGAVDAADIGDVDHARNAAARARGVGAGVQVVDHHGAPARIVHADLPVAVERAQHTTAGVGGVHDLPVELDVAAAHLGVVEHETALARVIAGTDIAVVADQPVGTALGRGALGPVRRFHVGVGPAGGGFYAPGLGVVRHKGAVAAEQLNDLCSIEEHVILPLRRIDLGLAQAEERWRPGQ